MREMKDSGVKWVGEIPSSWKVYKVKQIADSNNDVLPENYEEEQEIDYIEIGSVTYEHGVRTTEKMKFGNAPSRARRIVHNGDTIISTVRTYLKAIAYIDDSLADKIVSTGFSVVTPHKDVVAKFLYYALSTHSFISNVEAHSVGISYPAINNTNLMDLKIVLPMQREQIQIASYLDAKCSKIDEIIEKQQAIIEKLKEYKFSIITEAVTKGINPDVELKDRAIDSAEKDCGIRLLEADPKAEGVIGTRVLPNGWVARKPSDIYWNGIRTFGIFCDYGLSIPEYVSLAVKLKEQKSVSRLGNRNDDAEENDKDDSDAGDISNIRFWNLPIYHDDWRDNLTIELTQEEAFYLDKQIQKSTKGSLLEYVLKNRIDLNEYDDFASLTAELSEKVSEKLAYMMKLACDFNNLVYMARVRYNVMLSEGENAYANDEWSRLLPDIKHNAIVNLDAVFEELQLINPRAKIFLCGIQAAFMASDIDMADELIRKRERSLKGAARAKLSRTKEFDHSKWVGGGMLDYRFSNARRIVNDIYAGEVSADV